MQKTQAIKLFRQIFLKLLPSSSNQRICFASKRYMYSYRIEVRPKAVGKRPVKALGTLTWFVKSNEDSLKNTRELLNSLENAIKHIRKVKK